MANDNLNEEEKKIIPRLHPDKARKDIKDVNDAIIAIQNAYASAVKELFVALEENWTSPRAVDFYIKASLKIKDIDSNIRDFNEELIRSLVSSFNRIAPSHRERSISVSTGPYMEVYMEKLSEIGKIGVGMDETLVEGAANRFIARINNLKNSASYSNRITFYDTNGHLAGTGDTRINSFKTSLNSWFDGIISIVKNEVLKAVSDIREGKNAALSSINS